MDLVRDVLDKKVVDRNGRDMGRVDSLILEVSPGAPPRLAAFEIGPAVLARRVWRPLGRLVAACEVALGVDAGRPTRIAFAQVIDVNQHVKVDLAFADTAAAAVEQRLRHWVGSIPGSS